MAKTEYYSWPHHSLSCVVQPVLIAIIMARVTVTHRGLRQSLRSFLKNAQQLLLVFRKETDSKWLLPISEIITI